MWDMIAGQEEVGAQLRATIANGELSHAYLFLGSAGAGKLAMAKALAAALNCSEAGCGNCPICRRIQNDIHPDVTYVEPEGNFFTIEQVRELQHDVNLKPFEAQKKVYILSHVDKMTQEAANALLKTLEEPPRHVLFILLTTNLEGMPQTVVSRCQVVRFKPVSVESLIDVLVSKYKVKEADAELFARLSGGILAKAMQFAESDAERARRKMVLGVIEEVPVSDSLVLAEAAEKIITNVKKPLDNLKKEQKKELEEAREFAASSAHATRLKNVLGKKHKRRLNREERSGYNEVLSVFSSWYRDLVVVKETSNQGLLINIDCVDLLQKQSEQTSSLQAQKAIEVVLETKQRLKFNVNPQLAFETMLFELKTLSGV